MAKQNTINVVRNSLAKGGKYKLVKRTSPDGRPIVVAIPQYSHREFAEMVSKADDRKYNNRKPPKTKINGVDRELSEPEWRERERSNAAKQGNLAALNWFLSFAEFDLDGSTVDGETWFSKRSEDHGINRQNVPIDAVDQLIAHPDFRGCNSPINPATGKSGVVIHVWEIPADARNVNRSSASNIADVAEFFDDMEIVEE